MNLFYKKKLRLGDVFHLTLVTPNNAKIIYLSHLRICTIVGNRSKLEECQNVLCYQKHPQNLIQLNPNDKNFFPLIQTAFKSLQQSYETRECFTVMIQMH